MGKKHLLFFLICVTICVFCLLLVIIGISRPNCKQLINAVSNNDSNTLVNILVSGANPDCLGSGWVDGDMLMLGTPLHAAVQDQNYKIAQLLIDYGADPNLQTSESAFRMNGMTPLFFATAHDDVQMAKILLEAKASLNIRNDLDMSPLGFSLISNSYKCVVHYLEIGCDPNDVMFFDSMSLLAVAVEHSNALIVEALVEAGADISWQSPLTGQTIQKLAQARVDSEREKIIKLVSEE